MSSPSERPSLWWGSFAVAAAAAVALFLYQGRSTIFFEDEWVWLTERRTPSVDAFLQPHVGHFSAIPVALYQIMFSLFGSHYLGYRVVGVVMHVALIALVFALLRRNLPPGIALTAAVVLLFFGAGWEVPLWPFTVTLLLSMIGGFAAFLLVDRRTRAADGCAAVASLVALASSALGIPFIAGLGLELLLRREWRRLWIAAGPLLLFSAWLVVYGQRSGRGDGIVATVRWVVEWTGDTTGALVGLNGAAGEILLVPMVVLIAWGVARATPSRRPRVVAFVTITVVTVLGTAISRAGFQPSSSSRYLYVGAVLVVVTAGECLAGVHFGHVGTLVVVIVAAWALVFNLGRLSDGRAELVGYARGRMVQVSAIDLAARTLDPSYKAAQPPHLIDGDPYVEAFDAIGLRTLGVRQIRHERDVFRRQADDHLVATIGMPLLPATVESGAAPEQTRGSIGRSDGASCLVFAPVDGRVAVEVRSRTPRLAVESVGAGAGAAAPVDLRVRAFADRYFAAGPVATVPAGGAGDFPTPAYAGPAWKVGIRSAGSVRVCGAGG